MLKQKYNKRSMARTITGETKRGRPKKRPKDIQPTRTKRRERSSPFGVRKLYHPWPL
jgi:hypothetical protein